MTDKSTPLIRPYRPSDRDAVRRICCDTAYRNKGAELYFEDREIHADYWSSYYTDMTPAEVQVVEMDGRVIGYFFGCPDTPRYRRAMARRIVPWAIARALWRIATGRYRKPMSRRYIWFMITRAPAEEARIDIHRFPAHYHCNITEDGRGHKLYSTLTLAYLDRLEAAGVTGIHGHITEPAKAGLWDLFDRQFSEGYDSSKSYRAEKPTKINDVLLGDDSPLVNRVWGCDIPTFRAFVTFLRDRMRI
ncbi:MAG: hypothetical protein QNJ13_11445 [Paracoccaceae bacterium]|nr:hypothetical protein [Paracoccaceae bacterium]